MFFNWKRWLTRKNLPICKQIGNRRRQRFSPQVEQLETRLAPAVIATVDTTNDTHWDSALFPTTPEDAAGNVSLRSAIEFANANDGTSATASTIDFLSTLTGTINLSTAGGGVGTALDITDANPNGLTIDGSGVTAGVVVSGGTSVGVFEVGVGSTSSVKATINNVEITGGNAASGAGVYVASKGNLVVTNSTIDNNTANVAGGGAQVNGGGSLTLTNDTLYKNSSLAAGAIWNSGTLILTSDTITGNDATGSPSNGGGILNETGGTATILDTIVARASCN